MASSQRALRQIFETAAVWKPRLRTCYSDSGGPHFIHMEGEETNIVVSITVTGDAPCKASDKTYRMGTPLARSFLAGFVTLP